MQCREGHERAAPARCLCHPAGDCGHHLAGQNKQPKRSTQSVATPSARQADPLPQQEQHPPSVGYALSPLCGPGPAAGRVCLWHHVLAAGRQQVGWLLRVVVGAPSPSSAGPNRTERPGLQPWFTTPGWQCTPKSSKPQALPRCRTTVSGVLNIAGVLFSRCAAAAAAPPRPARHLQLPASSKAAGPTAKLIQPS